MYKKFRSIECKKNGFIIESKCSPNGLWSKYETVIGFKTKESADNYIKLVLNSVYR